MSFVPGMGILKGMALTLRRFFAPKVTIRYPEVTPDIAVKYRGRMQLLYDEHGTLKCETCFQCAQACPIECIDMGGSDTKGQYAIHWGASETYGERREEAALRRAGREVPDPTYTRFEAVDTAAVDRILEDYDYDPHRMLSILEAIQAEFGHLPVAALKQVSFTTGSWYAMIYGTATYYRHFRFEKTVEQVAVCRCTACLMQGGGRLADALAAGLRTALGQVTPDGRMRLAWLPTHLAGAPAPLVALDGEPQPEVTPANATAWARALAGEHPATRTLH
jgi:NADH:ubiquinone oxidoreductase subunit E